MVSESLPARPFDWGSGRVFFGCVDGVGAIVRCAVLFAVGRVLF